MIARSLLALTLCVSCASTQERRRDDDFHGAFQHIERAVKALVESGRGDAAESLAGFARELRQRMNRDRPRDERRERERPRQERQNAELEEAKRQLQVFRYAKAAFAETENERLVEMVERVMHARELRIAGRRDREAMQIYERMPSLGNQAELLMYAGKLFREKFDAPDRAQACAKLGEQLAERAQAQRRREGEGEHREGERRREGEGERREREEHPEIRAARRQVKIMGYAFEALREAERRDSADMIERSMKAIQLAIDGVRNEKAAHVQKTAPNRAQRAELLGVAAEILADQGKGERAHAVAQLARDFADQDRRTRLRRREREQPAAEEREDQDDHGDEEDEREGRKGFERRLELILHHVELLHERASQLQGDLERLHGEIRKLGR